MDNLVKRFEQMSPEKRAYALNMPVHFIQAKELPKLEKILTDYEFIEIKAHHGLTFDLLQDFALVQRVWPDQEKERLRKQRFEIVAEYVEKLIAHSHNPDENLFPPVPSTERLVACTTPPVQPETYSDIEHIRIWGEFVSKHTEAIRNQAAPLFQMAYNSADSGPIVENIEKRLEKSTQAQAPWLSVSNRPKFFSDTGLIRALEGVEKFNCGVIMDSVGLLAASGGYSGSILVWDLDLGQPIRVLQGHTKPITALAAAFDIGQIVSGCEDGTIRIWDTHEATCVGVLEGHKGRIKSIAVTPVGRLAVSCGDSTVRIWDLIEQKCIARLDDQTIAAVAVTADGRRMILGGATTADHSLSIWDVPTLKRQASLTGHHAGLFSVAMTPDGRRAVSGSYDQNLGVWDLQTCRCLGLFHEHNAWVGAVAITPDGRFAVSGSGDGSLRLWDLDHRRNIALQGHMRPIDSIAISADGRYCLSAANEGGMHLWNLASSDLSVRKSPKMTILQGTADLNKRVWLSEEGKISVDSGETERVPIGTEQEIGAAGESTATTDLSRGISIHDDTTTCLWNLDDGELIRLVKSEVEVRLVKIIPGTTYGCIVKKDWSLELWNIKDGSCLKRTQLDQNTFETARALTPDSRYLVLSDYENSICLYDLEINTVSKIFKGHSKYVSKVEFAPDGKRVFSESLDHTLRIWNIEHESCIHKVENIDGQGNLALSPDSHCIVIGDAFNVRILDSADGKTLYLLSGHNHFVRSVVFSPDGCYVITCAPNSTMRIWNVGTGECIVSHFSDAGVLWPEIIAWPYIIANAASGKPSILHIENAPSLEAPKISARRLWNFGQDNIAGHWEDHLTAVCYYCGKPFKVESTMIGQDVSCPVKECGNKLHINDLVWDWDHL